MDPELLERLRRGFRLQMHADGRLSIADEPITHPRIIAALRRGLDVNDDGEPIVRFGEQWTYIAIADCMLRALNLRGDPPDWQLKLDDGRWVELDRSSLWEEPGHGLRCTVPAQPSARPLSCRFTNTAQMGLSPWLDLDEAGNPGLMLPQGWWPIPSRQPTRASTVR